MVSHEYVGRTHGAATGAPVAETGAPRKVLWRIEAPTSGRVYECATYAATDAGLELRLQRTEDDVLKTQLLADRGADLDDVSAAWQSAAIAKVFVVVE